MADTRAFYDALRAALRSVDPINGSKMLDWTALSPTVQGYYQTAVNAGVAARSQNLESMARTTFNAFAAVAYSGSTYDASLKPDAKAAWMKVTIRLFY